MRAKHAKNNQLSGCDICRMNGVRRVIPDKKQDDDVRRAGEADSMYLYIAVFGPVDDRCYAQLTLTDLNEWRWSVIGASNQLKFQLGWISRLYKSLYRALTTALDESYVDVFEFGDLRVFARWLFSQMECDGNDEAKDNPAAMCLA